MVAKASSGSSDKSVFERLAPIFIFLSIGLAFAVGILWEKVRNLEGGGAKVAGTQNQQAQAVPQAPQGPTTGKMTQEDAKKIPAVSNSDHIKGDRNAKVVLIEYSDYQCPFCAQFHTTAQRVFDEYKGEVAWVYRHFPLDQLHPQARPAANAAECVANIGGDSAFWKFTDYVFPNQTTALTDLSASAQKAGVNKGQFDSCLAAKRFESTVNDQYQGGAGAGVTGTPGNFIVNQKGDAWFIPGAYPYDQVKPLIDEALKS